MAYLYFRDRARQPVPAFLHVIYARIPAFPIRFCPPKTERNGLAHILLSPLPFWASGFGGRGRKPSAWARTCRWGRARQRLAGCPMGLSPISIIFAPVHFLVCFQSCRCRDRRRCRPVDLILGPAKKPASRARHRAIIFLPGICLKKPGMRTKPPAGGPARMGLSSLRAFQG